LNATNLDIIAEALNIDSQTKTLIQTVVGLVDKNSANLTSQSLISKN